MYFNINFTVYWRSKSSRYLTYSIIPSVCFISRRLHVCYCEIGHISNFSQSLLKSAGYVTFPIVSDLIWYNLILSDVIKYVLKHQFHCILAIKVGQVCTFSTLCCGIYSMGAELHIWTIRVTYRDVIYISGWYGFHIRPPFTYLADEGNISSR